MSMSSDILKILGPHLAAEPPLSVKRQVEFRQIIYWDAGDFETYRHQILQVFSLRLKSQCPSLKELVHLENGITRRNLRILATCEYARMSLLGLQRQLHFVGGDTERHSKADVVVATWELWPHIWRWIHGFYFQDTSSLDPTIVELIWFPEVRPLQKALISLIQHVFDLLHGDDDSCVGRILELAPTLPRFILPQWSSAARNFDDLPYFPPCQCRILCHLAVTPSIINDKLVAEAVGSSDDFAMCTLTHLQRLLYPDYGGSHELEDMLTMMCTSLTQSIHDSLLSMGSLSQMISIIDYITDANQVPRRRTLYGICPCLEYLSRRFSSSSGLQRVHEALNLNILTSVIRAAHSSVDQTSLDRLSTFLVQLTRYLICRSHLRAIKKSMRCLKALGLIDKQTGNEGFDTAWDHFKTSLEEMVFVNDELVVFEGRCSVCKRIDQRSCFRKCSVCSRLYCSRDCQESDWKSGDHRAICRSPNSDDIDPFRADKNRQFLTSLCCLKVEEFNREISLLYQKYILSHAANDLPPLAVVFDCTTYPTTITAGPPEAYLRSRVGQDEQEFQKRFKGMFGDAPASERIVFFVAVPRYRTSVYHILVSEGQLFQPSLPYVTYADFLRASGIASGDEVGATKKALEEVEEKLGAGQSVVWISGESTSK